MKYFIFILFLLLANATVLGQENLKHKPISEQFLKHTGVKQLLDSIIQTAQNKITLNANDFFNQKEIDFSIKEDKVYFIKNVKNRFSFIEQNIYNELLFRLNRYHTQDLSMFTSNHQVHKTNYIKIKNNLLYYTQARLGKEISKLYKYLIPKYLQNIAEKHKKINLKIVLNNQVISTKDIDINLVLNTNCPGREKIIILDKENSKINKPQDCNYDQINNIVINYKGYTYTFKAKPTDIGFPSQLMEVKSLLSKYSFEEIQNWSIYIDETQESVSIEIENVVQAKKTINLPKDKKLKKSNNQVLSN